MHTPTETCVTVSQSAALIARMPVPYIAGGLYSSLGGGCFTQCNLVLIGKATPQGGI